MSVATVERSNYTNIVPAINIQRTLGKSGSLTFGYTERIQSPNINQLNPFISRIDPKYITTGNPNLLPVTSHLFDLRYSKFWTTSYLISGINYTYTNNAIQNVTLYNPLDSISTMTYDNIGRSKLLNYSFTFNYSFSKKISFSTNDQISYATLNSSSLLGNTKNSGFQGNALINFSYANNGVRTELYSGYTSPRILLQGKSAPYYFFTLRISKTVLKNSGTIAAYVSNPEKKYFNSNSELNDFNFQQRNNTQQIYRSFGISLSYRFGKSNLNIKKNK